MNNNEQSDGVLPTVIIVLVVMSVCTVLVLAVFLVYNRIRIEKKRKRKRGVESYMTCKEEFQMLPVSRETETGSRNVAPSGQCIGNGDRARKIMTV